MTELYTREGEVLDTVPWQEYPRPLLKRDSYINLNGEWEFSLTQGDGTPEYEEKILVPFAVESMLSGIGKRVDGNNVMWYRRRFTLPQGFLKERLLLNIGAADRETTVFLNGKKIYFDQIPVIENGRTLVPVRAIFEAIGATIDWNGETQTVTATKDDIKISLTVNEKTATKNGEEITLEVPAKIISGRTLVPVRFVADCFGVKVDWDSVMKKVLLNK
jgi:hypothetical protein